jgi:hypothetical protein
MAKALSLIALVFAVSLAACQQQPVNVNPPIESPIQQPASVSPSTVEASTVKEATTPLPATTKKTTKAKQTTTPRLDDLTRRVKTLEDWARRYGVPL